MTNPNNAIGTNAAFSGRTSPNALNDITASFTAGIVSGWECVPKTGMTIQVGGQAGTRDVALAEDNAGNKLTINNRSGAPVEVTLSGAPSTNNRVDAIVAYVDNPSTGDDNTTDNPTTCGIIAVSGTVAANPTAPSEATIRSAITTDGATGGTAYYIVLATIYVGTNVTTIGSGVITAGITSQVEAAQVKTLASDLATTTQKLNDFEKQFNITNISTDSLNINGSKNGTYTLAQNDDGTIFKFYGTARVYGGTTYNRVQVPGLTGQYGCDTGLVLNSTPTAGYSIMCGQIFHVKSDDSQVKTIWADAIGVGTNGHIYVLVGTSSGNITVGSGIYWNTFFPPCLYFNADFGDTPVNP